MPVDLGKEHFISIEDLIELVVGALDQGEPFGLTRWADSSNHIMKYWGVAIPDPHPEGPVVHRYRGGVLSHRHWEPYSQAFLHGARTCDVLGVFANDPWTVDVMNGLPLDLTGKKFVYAWANRFLHSRREYVEEIFERPWRVALVGNRMPEFAYWLEEHFPLLEIVQCDTAGDWPDVADASAKFAVTKPQLALLSAGWFTSCLVGAARDAGVVAISCGHMPDWWLHNPPEVLPNTEFPRGPGGVAAHCEKHYKVHYIAQERAIALGLDLPVDPTGSCAEPAQKETT